jgi:hypothetical protein
MREEVRRQLYGVIIWAVAFAFVEAAVVVYLRRIFYPAGFTFPLRPEAFESILGVEIAREAATLAMLAAIGWLSDLRPWVRFAFVMVAFGIWDIFYYVWLWVVIGWPPSLFTLDILFLIPALWVGPVWAPIAVSMALIGCGAAIALRVGGGGTFSLARRGWIATILGGLIIIASFLWQGASAAGGEMPTPFPWWLFWIGMWLGLGAFYWGWKSGEEPGAGSVSLPMSGS